MSGYETVHQRIVEGAYERQWPEFEAPFPGNDLRPSELEQNKRARQDYHRQQRSLDAALEQKFVADLAEVYGLREEHPKVQKALTMAWENGHSNGLQEILSYFDDYVELLGDECFRSHQTSNQTR